MDRYNLIAQLVLLKKLHANTGETIEELCAHFQAALDDREIVYLEEDGKVVAFCDFSWISCAEDIEKVSRGEPTDGHVLHVINLVCTRPGLIWKIKQLLPFHLYITGEHDRRLHAPKGLPELMEV